MVYSVYTGKNFGTINMLYVVLQPPKVIICEMYNMIKFTHRTCSAQHRCIIYHVSVHGIRMKGFNKFTMQYTYIIWYTVCAYTYIYIYTHTYNFVYNALYCLRMKSKT